MIDRSCAALVACSLAAGCGDREAAPRAAHEAPAVAAVPVAADLPDLELHEELVAASARGRALATRSGDTITVWSRAGKKLGHFAASEPQTRERFAVSDDGALVAEIGDGVLRVVESATGKQRWNVGDHPTVWGEPAFSPDASELAVLVQGSVIVVDAWTGDERGPIDIDRAGLHYPIALGLTLPRRVWYSPDGSQLAIRCGTDAESPANHTLFFANARSRELVGAVLGHRGEIIYDAQWLSDGRIVSEDYDGTLRVIRDGHVEQTLALGEGHLGALAVSAGLDTAAVAGEKAITVWRRGKAAVEIPRANRDHAVAHLELVPGKVAAITTDGSVHTFAIPDAPPAADSEWTRVDPAADRHDAMLYAIASGKPDAGTPSDPELEAARAFAAWRRGGTGAYRGAVDLGVIARYVQSGFVRDAHDMMDAWLARPSPAAGDDARAKQIVLELSRAEDTLDLDKPIISAVYARWPQDADVVHAYARAFTVTAPERADAALRKLLARTPHDVEAWKLRLELAATVADGDAVYHSARRVLTPGELAELRPR